MSVRRADWRSRGPKRLGQAGSGGGGVQDWFVLPTMKVPFVYLSQCAVVLVLCYFVAHVTYHHGPAAILPVILLIRTWYLVPGIYPTA